MTFSESADYLEGKLIGYILRNQSFTQPTTLYVAACTAATTDADTGSTITEPSGGSYARVAVTCNTTNWTAPGTNGLTDNGAAITFPTATGSWGTVSHIAICDASSAGNVILHGALTVSKTITSGDVFSFPVGDLDITFA